jgi:hypothetical protein
MKIQLEEHDDLWAELADFLSRLGMTFRHGDYSGFKDTIPSVHVARSLALGLHQEAKKYRHCR